MWILTDKRNRKAVGSSTTHYVVESFGSLEDSAKVSRLTNRLEGLQELTEEHGDKEAITTKVAQYDELFGK